MQDFEKLELQIHDLVSVDPEDAVRKVRALGTTNREAKLKSDTYIDAGIKLGKPTFVRAGICILKKLEALNDETSHIYYSIANGLSAYSEIYDGVNQSAEMQAAFDRQARAYYGKAMVCEEEFQLRSQASTNIANHLNKRARYVEALDYFKEAIEILPQNSVAACGELSLLMQKGALIQQQSEWYRFYGDFEAVLRRCMKLRCSIEENFGFIGLLAGEEYFEYAAKLIEASPNFDLADEDHELENYEIWVKQNCLALSLFCSDEEYSNSQYDLLSVPSVTKNFDDGHEVPDVFRMFNILKSDYVLARRLAYDGQNEKLGETANYSDTMDFAIYGINVSALANAQKMSVDILDKISVIIATLLKLPSPEFFQFKKHAFWKKKKATQGWQLKHEEVEKQIEQDNVYMSAFLDMISDLYDEDEGYLSHLTSLRNFSTHRFLSVHDMGLMEAKHEKQHVGHLKYDQVVEGTLKSLRLARAGLFYLVDFIKELEDQKNADGVLRFPMAVPDHHWIRNGE